MFFEYLRKGETGFGGNVSHYPIKTSQAPQIPLTVPMRLQEIQQAKSPEIFSRSNPNISRVPSPREPRSHAAPPARAPAERFYFSLQTLGRAWQSI